MHPIKIKETLRFFIIALMMIVALPSFAASKDVTMQAGETETLYLPTSVTSLDLRSVTFYSNGISYVQVLSYNNYSVTIKAIKAFSSPIIVRCDYYYFVRNGGYTYQTKGFYDFLITVTGETKVRPTSISFPSTVVAVEVGESRQLTPTVYPADAEYTLTWSINDKSVATVSQTGLLTGKSEGYADLKVSADNGVYTMLRVAVSEPKASSVSVIPSSLSLVEGGTGHLSASVSPSSANQSVTWTSDNTSVAKVSTSGKVTAVSPGSCRITAKTSNGRTDYCSVTVTKKIINPTSISLPESINITVGDNTTLTPTIIPADAETTLTWSSSDGNIAAVSNGTIEAKSVGACDITVSTSNGLTSTCRVTVNPILPESISLSENLVLRVGDSERLSAVVLPDNAETTLTWTSSDENVASVSGGNINAVGIGECDITVSTGNGLSAQCHVVVKPVLPTQVMLSAEEIVMTEGDTEQLTATVEPIGAEHIISWHSTDETIASVSSDGLVTALSEGSCRIIATTGNNLMAECTVHVQKAAVEPTGISIIPDIELTIGGVYDIIPDIKPADASTSLYWESDNSAVASVENGSITALSEGECNVTVTTSNNLSAVCHVVVKAKVVTPESIELSEYDVTLAVGESRTLTASVYPVEASTTLTWSSSDGSIATVSNGTIEAKSVGTCDITVSTSNGLTSTCRVIVKPILPESISLSENLELRVGDSERLSAVVLPDNAETTLTWTSSDENVASVSGGNVNAVGIGECDITVATGNGLSAQCHVIVKPVLPTQVMLSAEEIVMTEGDTEQLTATVEPIGAEHIISWHSTDETIASVSSDGLVSALSEGSCRITATTCNNLMAECTVHVQKAAVEPTGISIIPDIELTIGGVYDIIPDIKPADASTSLYWESDNSAVASVENGSITALSEGECNVTVTTSNNLSAVCHVVVKAKVVTPESIELSEYDVTLAVGESRTLTASVYPVEASVTLDWMSTDENVATVSDGCVVAIGAGRCEIIASAGNGIENSCHIVVEPASVPDNPEITSDWSGTYHMTAAIELYRESAYAYPSEFDLTIVEREGDYYITSIIGMDCTSEYPYEGMKLIIESPSKAYIDLEHNDGLGWKDIYGSHIDNLHSMSPSPEHSYNPQPVYLTRTNNDDMSIQDFYVFAFGSDTDYEQEKEVLYTNCSGMKESSGMSGIPNLTTDEDNPYVEVYNLNGGRVFSGEKSQIPQLRNGIYIFRSGNESHKVIVR